MQSMRHQETRIQSFFACPMDLDAPYKVIEYVKSEVLRPGERILWKGRPHRLAAVRFGMGKMAMGLIFTIFSLVWIYSTYQPGDQYWYFGVLFLVTGLWVLVAPLRRLNQAAHTQYAITNERVLILITGRKIRTISILPAEITAYERIETGADRGSLQLRKTRASTGKGTIHKAHFTDGLWDIGDVRGAAEKIARLRASGA